MGLSRSFQILAAGILTLASATVATAETIPPQPIGFIGAKEKSSEPDDFFVVLDARSNPRVMFHVKVADLTRNRGQTRAWYGQTLVRENDGSYGWLLSKRKATKLSSFTLPIGADLVNFREADSLSTLNSYRMFWRVEGAGIYGTNKGGSPAKIFAETAANPVTGPFAIRYADYPFNYSDVETRALLLFTGYKATTGNEPFRSPGAAVGTTTLANIGRTKTGSNGGGFATLGSGTISDAYFIADNTADTAAPQPSQLWKLTAQKVGRSVKYGAVPFTSTTNGLTFPGKPTNIVSDGADLFVTAPAAAGQANALYRMRYSFSPANAATDLEVLAGTEGSDPQGSVFNTLHPPSQSGNGSMGFSMKDGTGTRRFARYSYFNDSVAVLGAGAGMFNPALIVDGYSGFFFRTEVANVAGTFLVKHAYADNTLEYIKGPAIGGVNYFPFNIREICTVSSGEVGGTVYFTADYYDNNFNVLQNVLFKLPVGGGIDVNVAEYCLTSGGTTAVQHLVRGAQNLRSVIVPTAGMFRLYFAAPVPSDDGEFVPMGTVQGVEPWVTADE